MNFNLWFGIHLNGLALFLRSLKWGGKRSEYSCSHFSFFSHFKMLLTYYCNTQKQSSGEFVKFVRKQLCQSLFFSNVAGRLKKRPRYSVLSEYLRETALDIKAFFFEFVLYRYSRNNWIFISNRALFALHVRFLNCEAKAYLVSPAAGRNSHYIDKVFMQTWAIRKLKLFTLFFVKVFVT